VEYNGGTETVSAIQSAAVNPVAASNHVGTTFVAKIAKLPWVHVHYVREKLSTNLDHLKYFDEEMQAKAYELYCQLQGSKAGEHKVGLADLPGSNDNNVDEAVNIGSQPKV